MRPALALSIGTAATILLVAGCTLLIPFDDVPNNGATDDDDGIVDSGKKKGTSSSSSSGDTSSSSSSGDTSSSSSSSGSTTSSSGSLIPPACDPNFDRTAINCATPANGTYTRPNCGSEPGLKQGAAVDSDLIDCTSQGVPACVRHCPHGCAEMPKGHNDSCDECFDKADGWYCGKDFKGDWGPDDGMAIHCVGHVQIGNAVCGAGKCATICPPDGPSPARPSCCTP